MSRFFDVLKKASIYPEEVPGAERDRLENRRFEVSQVFADDTLSDSELSGTPPASPDPGLTHAVLEQERPAQEIAVTPATLEGTAILQNPAHPNTVAMPLPPRATAPAPAQPVVPRSFPAAERRMPDAGMVDERLEELLDSLQPEPVAQLGKPAEIHIDRSARLLPHSTDPQVAEYYRSLRTKLVQARELKLFRTLAVTSPNPKEGKTVTVLNLALSFAMLPSFKVLVIDGDLRKGSLGKWLGADRYSGLGNYLEGTATMEQIVLQNDNFPVHFVVRGNSETSPGELLHGQRWKKFLHRMSEHYDLILVDCPPVNIVTDTQLLAAGCDGVLLVARAFTTTCKAFQKAVSDMSSFRIVGTVLNQATGMLMQRGYGVYGRYAKS